jgi:hypothetical protein
MAAVQRRALSASADAPIDSVAGLAVTGRTASMTSSPTVAVVHFPSGGHIRPMLPLVAALGQHGLRTVQWAPLEWEQACLSAGGEFRPLPDLRDLVWPPPIPFRIAEFLGGLTERLAPWMCEQVQDAGADVVLRDSFAQYGHYACDASPGGSTGAMGSASEGRSRCSRDATARPRSC